MHTIHRAEGPGDWVEATALLHDHADWIRSHAGLDMVAAQPSFASELGRLEAQYGAGDGALFLARWQGVAVGTIAVRFHADASAELKRMFVRPVARGRGVADRLVTAVVDAAADRRCDRIWLETLPGVMDAAVAVYRRHGFDEVVGAGSTLQVDGIVVMQRVVEQDRRCA